MRTDFDADVAHPWAARWRIPRVTSAYPGWRYEVAVVVTGEGFQLESNILEPTDAEAEIIASVIEKRCAWAYGQAWRARMRERAFDVDSGANTLILAKTTQGWRYRLNSHRDGLWPYFDEPDKQAEFPPTAAGLVAILDHACGRTWREWMASHPRIEQLARP